MQPSVISRITAPSDLSQISMAIVIGNQVYGVPAIELGDAFGFQPLDSDLTSWAAITRATGFDTFVATPSSANLRSLLTDETGTGAAVFADAPTISGTAVFSGVPSLTGGGLAFPATQVSSADANTIDDYKEGTFTPVVIGGTTAGVGTYTKQSGTYTKIGNRVFLELELNWSAHTGTGAMRVSGLPFTLGHVASFSVYWESLTYSSTPEAVATGTLILLRQNASGAGATDMAVDTAARLIISGQYRTSG